MHEVKVPEIGSPETVYMFSQWYVSVGDKVMAGDVIATFEADKSIVDIETDFSGTVIKLCVEENDEVHPSMVVCVLE